MLSPQNIKELAIVGFIISWIATLCFIMDGKPRRSFAAILLGLVGLFVFCSPKQPSEPNPISKPPRTVEDIPCNFGRSTICAEIICDLKHNEEYIVTQWGGYHGGIVKTGHKCN